MLRLIVFLLLLCVHTHGFSKGDTTLSAPYRMNISTFFGGFHPGGQVSIEWPLQARIMHDPKYPSLIGRTLELYNEVSLQAYRQKGVFYNNLLSYFTGLRWSFAPPVYGEIRFGEGISRTFTDAPVYRSSSAGKFERVRMAGNFYGFFSLGYGAGIDLRAQRLEAPVKLFVRQSAYFLFPYQSAFLPFISTEMGMLFSLNSCKKHVPLHIDRKEVKR